MVKIVEDNLPLIIEMCKKHKLKSLYVFGSAAADNCFNEKSDVDFLYECDWENYSNWGRGEFDIVANVFLLKDSLEKLLQRKVDLVPNKLKNPYFIQSVEKSKKLIYARP